MWVLQIKMLTPRTTMEIAILTNNKRVSYMHIYNYTFCSILADNKRVSYMHMYNTF